MLLNEYYKFWKFELFKFDYKPYQVYRELFYKSLCWIITIFTDNQLMDKWDEFHLFLSKNTLYHIIIVIGIIISQISQLFVYCLECLIAELVLKIYSKCLYSVSHWVRSLYSRKILQEFWVHSHIRWFFTNLVLVWVRILIIVIISLIIIMTLLMPWADLLSAHHTPTLLLNSTIILGWRWLDFGIHIFIILVLTNLLITFALHLIAMSGLLLVCLTWLAIFEVIRKSTTLRLGSVILLILIDLRELGLRLRATSTSSDAWLDYLILSSCWTSTSDSDFLFLLFALF